MTPNDTIDDMRKRVSDLEEALDTLTDGDWNASEDVPALGYALAAVGGLFLGGSALVLELARMAGMFGG